MKYIIVLYQHICNNNIRQHEKYYIKKNIFIIPERIVNSYIGISSDMVE